MWFNSETDAIVNLPSEGSSIKTYSTYTCTNISVGGRIVGAVFSETMTGEAFLLYYEYKGYSRFAYCYASSGALTMSASSKYKITVYYI